MGTVMVACNCKSDFQDAVYGKGNRIANSSAAKDKAQRKHGCTVCGRMHENDAARQVKKVK